MRIKIILSTTLLALASLVCAAHSASSSPSNSPSKTADSNSNSALVNQNSEDIAVMRVEGERRFKSNCGRCHAAPHKFPPRMMATIVRHMRVRATITDEDRRLILLYMTQ